MPEYSGDIFLTGHTHCGNIQKDNDIIFANPGSITNPRNGTQKSYLTIDEKEIALKTLDGEEIIKEIFTS